MDTGQILSISGSDEFRQQVASAIDVWFNYDKYAGELEEAIVSINEHDDNFKVYTEADRNVYVARNVAFWPDAPQDLQVKILATYIGHEAIHAYLRMKDSPDWNTTKGEAASMEYQNRMARELGVPPVYVNEPVLTIPGAVIVSSASSINNLAILFGLGAAAAVAVAAKRVTRGRTGHPALVRR